MINGKFFPKLLFLILSLQIISSNLKSIKKLNKPLNIISDSQDFSQSYIDLNDPDVMEREYKKIRHYESIERGQVRHLNPLEIEESQKKEKLRYLSESNVFYNGISFIQPAWSGFPWTCYWARLGLGSNGIEPNLYVYPYPFTHEYNNTEGKVVKANYYQGAYISTRPDILLTTYGSMTDRPFYFYRAKALAYSDVAILNIEATYGNRTEELFQDGSDWSTFFQSYLGLTYYQDFDSYHEQKMKNPNKFFVSNVNETSINRGDLMIENSPRFKVLIVPDYKLGSDNIIKSKLGDKGKQQILKYYNNGGIIIITGKSGTLFEDFGLIQTGTYDRKRLFSINNNERKVGVKGCEDVYRKEFDPQKNDFEKRVICMSTFDTRRIGLSTTFKTIKKDTTFNTLLELNSTDENLILTNTNDGLTNSLTEKEKEYNPLILHKSNSKNGQLFVLNYNPLFKGTDLVYAFNTIMLAFTKDLFINSKISLNTLTGEQIIPAGEPDVEIGIETSFQNLFDKDITNLQIYFFIPDNTSWVIYPNICSKKNDYTNLPSNIKVKKTIETKNYYLLCEFEKLSSYEIKNFTNKIKILNYAVTQLKDNVEILDVVAIFKNAYNKETIISDCAKVNCQTPPAIRAAINVDPLGNYPVYGFGQFKDNSIKIENKGESDALDLEYTGIYSIIAALNEQSEQDRIIYRIKFYVDYYNRNNYYVPFSDDHTEDDLIDTNFLNNKGIILVADYDAPVLQKKEINTDVNIDQAINIYNINASALFVNSTTESIREINYKNSERFYKIAAQRLNVFVDDTTPIGAKTLYGDEIPEDIVDPVLKDRAKMDFIFMRQDLYFYENNNYINPEGIKETIIFSIDRLEKYEDKVHTAKTLAEAKSKKIVEGYYTNREEDKKSTITKPHIWSNTIFETSGLTIINPTKEEEIIKHFGNLDTFKPVHFIYPIKYQHIIQPNQIFDFEQVNEHYGYHQKYPEVKFIYVHKCNFIIENIHCINGGKIIINLKNYSIKNSNQVTVSPDQIAVYDITYNDGNITIYFKRGLMSNERYGKNMNLIINIEDIEDLPSDKIKNPTFEIIIEELIYDISYPPTFEKYNYVTKQDVTFEYAPVFSFPALQMIGKLNRTLNGYETIEPFARIGGYLQELYHRQVYGPAEAHYRQDPGITSRDAGYNMISQLGINPIPFVEYVNSGKVPYAASSETTSRIGWKDIWGRSWYQPMRTTYPDFIPIPPPVKNLVMSTTFEIIRGNKQIYEWPSDENVQIHLHIKILNNYLKYWDITRCLDNRVRFVPGYRQEYHNIVHENELKENLKDEEIKGDNTFIREGTYARYGMCYYDKRTVVRGENVTDETLAKIQEAILCSSSVDKYTIEECMQRLKDIPTVNKSPQDWNMTKLWNYSPLVESYYPEGYITNEMWTMNSYEYEDTDCIKAYRFHMDNQLPNYDNTPVTGTVFKPLNIIAVPIYKGLGYSITYDQNNEMNYHGVTRKGWWCDNLQNKDDTLLAGQEKSNKISVDKKEEIIWVDGKDLVGSTKENSDKNVKDIINFRLTNIYTCLFNRKRAQNKKNTNKIFEPINIAQNNIVPILVDLEKEDKRYYNYECKGEQYTPENIYQEKGNLLVTPTDKDYLYFAANLRGAAKESFNVLMNLNYFSKLKYEGIIKINEGSRFVYWNPGWSENSYMVYDNPVSLITAKRNDITITHNILPSTVETFNAVMYNLFTIKDENKINKEWPYNKYYENSYGFGDVSVTVAVGGIKNSKPILNPGETTYAKIIFYNNCGFDWNMKAGAIDFEYKGEKKINAFDYYMNFVHTIQEPKKYNFLNYIVEEPYKKYINIEPSNHNIEVAPEFFDFGFINVVTIRDGFKGEYNLKITIKNDFPDSLRGKPIEIKIDLDTSYFDHFPGTNTDPTNINKFHTYQVKIPSIYIAVPFNTGDFIGKVLYTSAFANITDFFFTTFLDSNFEIKYVNNECIEKFINASRATEPVKEMDKIWNNLKNSKSLEIKETKNQDNKNVQITGILKDYPVFPQKRYGQSDTAEVNILIRSFYSQFEMGSRRPMSLIRLSYDNWIGRRLYAYGTAYTIQAKGAWFDISYSRTLVDYVSDDIYVEREEQELSPAEEGIIKVQFKLENIGNGDAYNVRYQILIGENVTYFGHRKGITKISETKDKEGTVLTFDLNAPINAGELRGGIIYLKYNKIIDQEYLESDAIKQLPTELNVAKQSRVILDLTDKKGENEVTQQLRKNLVLKYTNFATTSVYMDLIVSGRRKNPTVTIQPKIKFNGNNNEKDVTISIVKSDATKYNNIQNSTNNLDYISKPLYTKGQVIKYINDQPNERELSNENHIVLYTIYVYTDEGVIYNSYKYEQNNIKITPTEIFLIILSVIFYITSIVIVFFSFKRYKALKNTNDLKSIDDAKMTKLINE